MNRSLENRVALVTGGSRGIGSAIAIRLAEAGATVVVSARASDALRDVVAGLQARGLKALAVPADATDRESVAGAVTAAAQAAGRIDILINNVGGALHFGGFEDLTDEDWRRAFELNVMSMVHFVRAALPYIEKSQNARIVNISSLSGVEPGRYNPHYTTTKAATINLTKLLANSLADRNILVNAVCPGPVHSEAWNENIRQTARRLNIAMAEADSMVEAQESAKIPLGRVAAGKDIAGLVAFLATDEAAWITGACFHVNGGKMRST